MSHGDAGDQPSNAHGFLAAELAVLQVDVVNDLGDRLQCRVVETGAGKQHLETAAVALMGDFAFEHVEAQFPRLRDIALARHEADDSIRVDETAYQPATGDAVDKDALARNPNPSLGV